MTGDTPLLDRPTIERIFRRLEIPKITVSHESLTERAPEGDNRGGPGRAGAGAGGPPDQDQRQRLAAAIGPQPSTGRHTARPGVNRPSRARAEGATG